MPQITNSAAAKRKIGEKIELQQSRVESGENSIIMAIIIKGKQVWYNVWITSVGLMKLGFVCVFQSMFSLCDSGWPKTKTGFNISIHLYPSLRCYIKGHATKVEQKLLFDKRAWDKWEKSTTVQKQELVNVFYSHKCT